MLNHVRSLLVWWLIRDPSWYSMDYRIYMGSSMTVWLLQWLLLYLCSYKLDGFVTVVPTRSDRGQDVDRGEKVPPTGALQLDTRYCTSMAERCPEWLSHESAVLVLFFLVIVGDVGDVTLTLVFNFYSIVILSCDPCVFSTKCYLSRSNARARYLVYLNIYLLYQLFFLEIYQTLDWVSL
jgi:hypothetical protein